MEKDKLLQVKKGIMIELHNSDTSMGCHYKEDEWSIKVIAPTYEEAIKLLAPKYISSGINPDTAEIYNVEYVTYNNKGHVLEIISDYESVSIYGVIANIEEDPTYIKLKAESNERAKRKEKERKNRELKNREAAEIQRLKELKKKYPNI